ncbi:biotin--[acetyl-CoA-carboxylase] ligase [Corynebacterium caspium]|uniref:biotin--[acetyl-CoA-carboxylase] ligase n=1 Tax=Corynebacterium caspium TaxID=234828 RepID=UPI00035D5F8C|nr:biotin--[acetyl-CoA-carboxylase] ligase [Corynebacterium caspium]
MLTIQEIATTGSTNADILQNPAFPPHTLLVAHHQTHGRGRHERTWEAPPNTGLAMSTLVTPDAAQLPHLGLLPLAAGVAMTDVISNSSLKWPNDLLVQKKKICGILAEADFSDPEHPRIALGIGLNVSLTAAELPVENATSLRLQGDTRSEKEILAAVATHLETRLAQWAAADPTLLHTYRERCATLGQHVRIDTPNGSIEGVAQDITDTGEILLCRNDGTTHSYSAGDITHLRPLN